MASPPRLAPIGWAWKDFLLQGRFKGVPFTFIATREEHSRDVDRRRYPGRDGAELEDRGRNELSITVRSVFIDDDYPDVMNELLAVIDAGGVGELVHPVYGTIQALAERATVVHDADDAIDCASIEITFTEDTSQSGIGPFQATDTLAALAGAVRSACDDATAGAADLQAFVGAA